VGLVTLQRRVHRHPISQIAHDHFQTPLYYDLLNGPTSATGYKLLPLAVSEFAVVAAAASLH
jgi:membrane protein required for beta-lactamase induction